ncbi:MAG: hypothetical protein SNG35_06940 [Rikenellaceae bacterium]
MKIPNITRQHRAAFIIMVDFSASMNSAYIDKNGHHIRKGDYIIEKVNEILRELYTRAHRGRKIYNYYDIAVIAYAGDRVEVLTSPDGSHRFTPVNRLYRDNLNYFSIAPLGSENDIFAPRGGEGAVRCRLDGFTPMFAAMECVYQLICRWCVEECNLDSIAPFIINISDGLITDSDYIQLGTMIKNIVRVKTNISNALMLNLFVSSSSNDKSINFPTDSELNLIEDNFIRSLAEVSSYMPSYYTPMIEQLRGKSIANGRYRAIGANIDLSDLMSMLSIGTISIPTR